MFLIISIIIGFIIIKFLFKTEKQKIKVAKEGGMLTKYERLANYFLDSSEHSKLLRVTNDTLIIQIQGTEGLINVMILQTFGNVTIKITLENRKHNFKKIELDFEEYKDQELMISKIEQELEML